MADSCIFCRIVRGEVPATVIMERDSVLAIRDVSPQAPTHVLVIPRAHVESLAVLHDPALAADLLALARDVAESEGLARDGYRVVLNTGKDGGQSVFHLHVHVLGGRSLAWPPG